MLKVSDDRPMHVDDIYELIMEFKKHYRNVFVYQVDEQVFIYRTLSRKEYKDILNDERFNDFEKEEIICDTCLLYPDPNSFDWNDVDAGIPTELMKQIRKNSYLDGKNSRKNILQYYRSEMFDIDNQIICVINEAFPQYDIEEIEDWDIDKMTKYLTRAEWKLTNLRGLEFREPEGEIFDDDDREASMEMERDQGFENEVPEAVTPKTEEIKPRDNEKTIRGGSRKNKLTPEKMREREEFLRKFPMFANDDGERGIEGLAQQSVDVSVPAALQPGMY